jgi:hypothetical protein
MIEVERSSAGVMFTGELPAGTTAFVDADWIPDDGQSQVSPLLWQAGEIKLDGSVAEIPADLSANGAAISVLHAVAAEAVERIKDVPAYAVITSGGGITARMAAESLGGGQHGSTDDARPRAWIDFTGSPEQISLATAGVEDLGTVVLASYRLNDPGPVNLYPDVHARSLRLVGVGMPLSRPPERYDAVAPEGPTVIKLGVWGRGGSWFEIHAT